MSMSHVCSPIHTPLPQPYIFRISDFGLLDTWSPDSGHLCAGLSNKLTGGKGWGRGVNCYSSIRRWLKWWCQRRKENKTILGLCMDDGLFYGVFCRGSRDRTSAKTQLFTWPLQTWTLFPVPCSLLLAKKSHILPSGEFWQEHGDTDNGANHWPAIQSNRNEANPTEGSPTVQQSKIEIQVESTWP